ncbi:MAG: hypothetical protein IJY77_01845 [Alphaproteobacteria bacterium]|nr:hypothetical protein [Alphaproteobacteria bacterium]
MKKVAFFVMALMCGVGMTNAAERSAKSITRTTTAQNTVERTTSQKTSSEKPNRNTAAGITARTTTTQRNAARTATTARAARSATVARATTNTVARSATPTTSRARNATNPSIVRSATRPARATVSLNVAQSNTFGTGYNTCRDAYFTCMDQFCGTANDTYRRCICSTKLSEIKSRERALSQASDQLQDFKNLNLAVIDKTAAEVKAMTSASAGEFTQSISRDKSNSATQLAGISEVLSKTKNKSLSTQGTVDIAGDINAIWATTDLTGGANIANLTGEALYNAVHAQCASMVVDKCPSTEIQTMVVSAYGMYIENDCSLLINALAKKLTAANGTLRDAERELGLARLENYNAHNSSAINECIAQVRQDITANTACGADYVHCLDVTGRYLNHDTGAPIYSPQFYQLETQISLSGDILTNQTNRLLVAELNKKRIFAERGLDTCRDLDDEVWDEFMRQAITEIYQGQQERVRLVKNECLDVVNACYDEQSQSLKDFSNIDDQLLLGSRLELSEQMCQEKLEACSNLYGGGTHGMGELLTAMHEITNQKIAQQCLTTLQNYAKELCAVPSNDTLHAYPFACRVYAPGDQQYSIINNGACNAKTNNSSNNTGSPVTIPPTRGDGGGEDGDGDDTPPSGSTTGGYVCPTLKKYTSCKAGYYMMLNGRWNDEPTVGNSCQPCNSNCTCAGGTAKPVCEDTSEPIVDTECGDDYVGSLYHKMVRYALQACVRPSETSNLLPSTVQQDVNIAMDQIRTDMARILSAECDRLGGLWIDTVWQDTKTDCDMLPTAEQEACLADIENGVLFPEKTPDGYHDITGNTLYKRFYDETSANTKWGYCATDDTIVVSTSTGTTGTSSGSGNGSGSGGPNSSGDNTPNLNCTAGDSVTVTLSNTTGVDCCPDGAVSPETQTITAICGEYPTWPSGVARATCSTNENCKLIYYTSVANYPSSGIYYGASGTSPSMCTGPMTIYSIWSDDTATE